MTIVKESIGAWHHFTSAWWRHQMETFSALLAIFAGNSPVPGEFPTKRPVTRCFDVFFDLRLNKRLNKQSWGWWFELLSCPLWCHSNGSTELYGVSRSWNVRKMHSFEYAIRNIETWQKVVSNEVVTYFVCVCVFDLALFYPWWFGQEFAI